MYEFDPPMRATGTHWYPSVGIQLIERARALAHYAHRDQKRKYTGEPYITHPAAVVSLIEQVPHTPEMIAAAWLHDTIEDCGVDESMIRVLISRAVAEMVVGLTDVSRPEHGNRRIRKQMDLEHLAAQPADVQTIKVADICDNTISIVAHDPAFAKVYLVEKAVLLSWLTLADSSLLARAWAQVAGS